MPAELVGHGALLDGLWRAAARSRLPHALLLEGPAGVGKFLAALRLVQGLLCANGPGPPCASCGPCKRFAADSHPDAYVLDPRAKELETIPVHYVTPREQHRDVHTVEEFLALRAAEGGWRAVVLRDFDRANPHAQNALLKTLEEPGRSTLLALESSRADLLLDTIRSRCARIRFGLLERDATRAVLEREGVAAGDAALLARWCGGAPGRAIQLQREGALETRAILGALLLGELDPLAAARRLGEVEGAFAGKTELAPARARARAAVELALELGRDLLRAAHGAPPGALPHGDLVEEGLAPPPPAAVAAAVDGLLRARQDVDANLAPDAILDRTCLALERLVPAGAAGRPEQARATRPIGP